jgi:integrase
VFGATTLASIDHLAVREWFASLSASGLAPATVRKCAQVMGKIMRGAVDAGLLVTSPCERQPLPRVARDEQRFLTPAEVERLADAITPPCRPLVFVGAYGGLRAAEMYGLRRHRADLLRATVDVTEIVVEVQAATSSGRPRRGRSAPRAAPPLRSR